MNTVDDDDDYYPGRREPWDENRKPGWDMVRASRRLKNILEELGIRSATREESKTHRKYLPKKSKTKPRQDP